MIFIPRNYVRCFILFSQLLFPIVLDSVCQKVIIDLSKSQPVFLTDPHFAGLRQFSQLLAAQNVRLEVNYEELHKVKNAIIRNGKKRARLILFPAVYRYYSYKELRILKKFIGNGGHLILVGEHDNFFDHASFQNKILGEYGVKLKDTSLKKTYSNDVSAGWLDARWHTNTEECVRVYLPACYTVHSKNSVQVDTLLSWSSVNRARRELLALRVRSNHESGKISAISDFEIFWNMAGGQGIQFGCNPEFLMKLLEIHNTDFKKSAPSFLNNKFNSEDSNAFLINLLYSDLFNYSPWKKLFKIQNKFPLRIYTSWKCNPEKDEDFSIFLMGPHSRFLEAMQSEVKNLEKKYPGIDVDKKMKRLFELFRISHPLKSDTCNFPYILSNEKLNDLFFRIKEKKMHIHYPAGLKSQNLNIEKLTIENNLTAPAYARYYAAPIMPHESALRDTVTLVASRELIWQGPLNKTIFFNGGGMSLINPIRKNSHWKRLTRYSYKTLMNWYKNGRFELSK